MAGQCTFVHVQESPDGIGKLVDSSLGTAEIEYFIAPAGPRLHKVHVPIARVREVELSPQTRVFWFDAEQSAWRAGRVDGGLVSAQALGASEDHYHVRFPNGYEDRVPVSSLYVRWSHPIEDPTDYLAARITDTPFFFDGRSRIVRYLSGQRAAFGRLTGLASAAVDLLEHQVTTVRRVLGDPIERYLLADEVGLGKTIEAGILIRQHVIDCPNDARVLVVVPEHLVHQWTSELGSKFSLPATGAVTVIPQDVLRDGAVEPGDFTMLVVDEAHRPALDAFDVDPQQRRLYERLCDLAMRVPRVLLLSGTPVLHQEHGFLAMLHLLDPEGYCLKDRESFRRRVRDRQIIAEATADLSDDASSLFVEEAIRRLESLFTEDQRLVELCNVVRSLAGTDIGDEERIRALRSLRTHLSETYRLHRRLLRTRREDPRVRHHLPRRTGAIRIDYEDHAREEAFDFLETWRLALPAVDDTEQRRTHERLFARWVESAFSHPRVLVRLLDATLKLRSGDTWSVPPEERQREAASWAFDGEESLLRERRELIADSLKEDMRALQLAEWLRSNREIRKVVLFVSDPEVADLVVQNLSEALEPTVVVRHQVGSDGVHAFQQNTAVRVLVCDATAEEGLNFQRFGATVVHYDLPLEPGRIEQRIGRVDRIEARGRMRNVVFSSGCAYEREWLACLTDTVRVFERSVAPLQYVLLDATAKIRARLAHDGPTTFEAEAVRMRDPKSGIDAELRRIRAQEALDSIEVNADRNSEFFALLEEADGSAEEDGESAFRSWVVERLQFVQRNEASSGLRYVHDTRRPTLVPLQETATRFAACIDRDPSARQSRTELPLQTVTFERAMAEARAIGLLRVGHPFVDALEALVRADDRGAAFAMWRHVPGLDGVPRLFLRFDFVIEADISNARAVLASRAVSPQALRRRADDAFPVEYRTIWLDSDLEEVRDQRVLKILELPYSQHQRQDGGRDVNLRLERWERADALAPVGDWEDLCLRGRRKAEELLRSEQRFLDGCRRHAKRLHDAAATVDDALRSRIARLTGTVRASEESTADLERRLSEAIASGIQKPSIRVDSAGAVFLSAAPLVDV